jgi:hypothetical protein
MSRPHNQLASELAEDQLVLIEQARVPNAVKYNRMLSLYLPEPRLDPAVGLSTIEVARDRYIDYVGLKWRLPSFEQVSRVTALAASACEAFE